MEARTMSLSPPASHDGAGRCLFAIELSKKSWIVAVITPLSDKISEGLRLEGALEADQAD